MLENEYVEFIFKLSAIIVAITTVGKFLVSIWKKGVAEPQNRAMERVANNMMEPIIEKLDQTLDFMADSKRDRIQLHERTICQDERIEDNTERIVDHNVRITVLEKGNGHSDSGKGRI